MHNFLKAGLLAAAIVIAFILSWEIFVRSKGYPISYDDGGPLWSYHRARVYQPADKSTVFIGSSRIKYDLDIPTWKSLTGEDPVMLAIEGNSPLPVLENLANDNKFKGKLVIDVTEILFFSLSPYNNEEPKKDIKYFKDITPAQRAGFYLNHFLESNFVFLDKEVLSLNAFMNDWHIKDRPGVFRPPDFPWQFGRVSFTRQDHMTDSFLADTNLQNKVKGIWEFLRSISKEKPPQGRVLDSILQVVKINTDKIRARGGTILFVRTPSSGGFWMGEQMGFPRNAYWDRLLTVTQVPGIHFADYPAIDHFQCPELSHLSPRDAITFTREFVRILQSEKGWSFASSSH
jgi:hypothetical protein